MILLGDTLKFFLFLFFIFSYVCALFAIIHCLLVKKLPQSTLAWCATILFLPLIGTFLYFVFGINRIDSRAGKLIRSKASRRRLDLDVIRQNIAKHRCKGHGDKKDEIIYRIGHAKSFMPLQEFNHVQPLYNGDQAYPKMLEAINEAQKEVFLSTFIFSGKKVGQAFVDALILAKKRGVDVRVIVDGIGGFISFRRLRKQLEKANIDVHMFVPPELFPPHIFINLRNHRKLLICDSKAFTGGMNIGDDNVLALKTKHPIQDVHFQFEGGVVLALREAFLLDWEFITDEEVEVDLFTPTSCGKMSTRVIMDGLGTTDRPIVEVMTGAISTAKSQVTFVTPYFIPTSEFAGAVGNAMARGVKIRIILPKKCNHALVAWASEHNFAKLLKYGVEIYHQPPPFAHTKLMIVDNLYVFLGSSNIDPRSFEFNFELNVEVFSKELNHELTEYTEKLIAKSEIVTSEKYFVAPFQWKGLFSRIRNAAAWIFSPYL